MTDKKRELNHEQSEQLEEAKSRLEDWFRTTMEHSPEDVADPATIKFEMHIHSYNDDDEPEVNIIVSRTDVETL